MTSLFGAPAQNNNQSSGLFGANTSQQPASGTSLFGGANTAAKQPGNAPSLFGASAATPSNNSGGGLFGANNNNQSNNSGGLFGSNSNQTNSGALGSTGNNNGQNGLFGGTQNAAPSAGGGLFGTTSNAAPTSSGLFGSNTTANQGTGGSLFGASNTQAAGGAAAGSVFGNNNAPAQSQANASSLFGSGPAAASNTGSIFGAANNQPATSSLFNAPAQQPQNSIFGGGAQGQAAQPQQPNSTSLYGMSQALNQSQLQRLQYSGLSTVPNEKKIADQIKTLVTKWNPDPVQGDTILKTYLYNAVDRSYAPFFYPDPSRGEDERSWEEALNNRPEPPKVDGADNSAVAYVPILCRGFKALGERVETQARIVQEMRARLHEMNNSLNAVMDIHQQRIQPKIAEARRRHQVISQRCIRLAVKVQVLRNRGYALDSAEEELRKTLLSLERQMNDAGFAGREDEVWARLVALRERARWLQEEGKRIATKLDEGAKQAASSDHKSDQGISNDVLTKARKILKDYDDQLGHLSKELQDVQREFNNWEANRRK